MTHQTVSDHHRAAEAIRNADALVITAGAGMGVDSGLPDFRGDEGFWKAYPPFRKLGRSFAQLANPRWFESEPRLAWGFYGHRLGLYRRTVPHAGYATLLRWGRSKPGGYAVFTSNVDGAFVRAGFDPERIVECHGAIDFAQCIAKCGAGIFSADGFDVKVDESTFLAEEPLPTCPSCGGLARPNILMFGDWGWDGSRTRQQNARLERWIAERKGQRVVVVECGAGTAISSVRDFDEDRVGEGATLVRINVREAHVPEGHVGLFEGALAALTRIDALL